MDVIGDFRYADDEFKDQDDNLRLVMNEMGRIFLSSYEHSIIKKCALFKRNLVQ